MLAAEILTAIASRPIPGGSPCGESLRFDEQWTTLEAEVGKLDSLAGGEVDWRAVEQGAAGMLADRGKDLLLMSWLARAMWQRDGMGGLAAGLETCRDLLANFWEGVHPQRVRARRGAIEWLSERLAPVLGEEQAHRHPEATARCQAAVAAIIAWGQDRFEGGDPGLSALHSRLRELTSGAASGTVAGNTAAAAVQDGAVGPIADRAQAVVRIRELGDWFARHEPHSPIVPLLRRAEQWSRMDFQGVFAELLRNRPEALAQLWDVLGVGEPPPQ
jgi:type VI secretion system ImpA/VasJ family protein